MVKGDDEIAALLAEMEQKQYGSVSEPAPQELDEPSVASLGHLQTADTKTLLRAEISRHFAFQEVKAKFDLLCAELAIQPDKNIFIRWLLKMKYLERERTSEPLIPVAPRSTDGNLLDEFKKLGVDKGKINWFSQDLARWTAKSYSKFVHVMDKASVKKIRVKLVEQTDGYVLQCGRSSVNISREQYKKLRSLYSAQNAHFHDRLFLTLMRYKPLQGRIMPSLPERVKAVLRKHLQIDTECYTTPVQTTTQRYCSLFADTDMCFGSLGNFIENMFDEGSFLVHPPIVHEIIDAAADHMERMLSSSSKPLSFAVVIPCWDARGVATIRHSEFARAIIETEPRDDETRRFHQHSGPAPAQLVVLQNDAGAAAWPVAKKLREEFLQAFHNKRARRNSDASIEEAAAAETNENGHADEQHEAENDEQAAEAPTQAEPETAVRQDGQKKKKRKLRMAVDGNEEPVSETIVGHLEPQGDSSEGAAPEALPTPSKASIKAAKALLKKLGGSGTKKRKPLRQR